MGPNTAISASVQHSSSGATDEADFDTCNPQVQELESGHIWWYDAHMLQSVADEEVPEQLQHPPPPGE